MIGIVNLHESCTYNTFTHNITYPDPNTPSWDGELIVNANTGANNQIKVDPKFSYLEYDSRYDHANDYTLQPDSPAKNAGTDGTDIGVTGGSMPFFSLQGGTSPIPQILTVDVQNASVPKGGVLEVKVKAHVQK